MITKTEKEEDPLYKVIDALVDRTDDPTMQALTFRVWVLGTFWLLVTGLISVFNYFRTTSIVSFV